MNDYTKKFYDQYGQYLEEPQVHRAHVQAARWLRMYDTMSSVLDLGCGLHSELISLIGLLEYVGIDLNAENHKWWSEQSYYRKLHAGNYRDLDLIKQICDERPQITTFFSLFSTECTANYIDNHLFYHALFQQTPVEIMIVSGFYYTDTKENPIQEAGGITSWQTLNPIESTSSNLFSEIRLIQRVPSKMFGPNVVEVWKRLERKK